MDAQAKIKKIIGKLSEEYTTIRVGRANPSVLDKIVVDYYGVSTPIGQVASISVPDPRTLSISPWEASLLKDIEKAILKSDLGLAPNNDGKSIRLTFPPLTEERRKEIAKTVHKYAEEARISIRNVRRSFIEEVKAQQKRKEITEDDLRDMEHEAQKMTDNGIKEIDELAKKKEKEVMEV